jgi:predicted TIM-barrel fold metal-dependent hydrolase
MRVDVHQHLWPEPFLAALAARRTAPRLRGRWGRWTLELAGEPACPVDLADHDPDRRRALLDADGIERALLAPSLPLGIEHLAPEEAWPLIDAWHDGVLELGERFGVWGTAPVADLGSAEVDQLLDRGCVGLAVGADTLATPAGVERIGPALEALARRGAPLFVHPGAAPPVNGRVPSWWPALTSYVAQMQAAWHAFALAGRGAHPDLIVCFAMLGGAAPVHDERLVARGAHVGASDDRVFVETSSYGPRAVDTMLRFLGVDQIVFGSDRPVVEPRTDYLEGAVATSLLERNPAVLLGADRPTVLQEAA